MTTQFDEIINRSTTHAVKWDVVDKVFSGKNLLPLWIADMDFAVAPEIVSALHKRVEHPIYGYTCISNNYFSPLVKWLAKKHGWIIQEEWCTHSPCVVASLAHIVQALSLPLDKILIQTPVYAPFFSVISNHGRTVVENKLIYTASGYEVDFDDFRAKLASGVKLFILCSPHNPVGRVWSKVELTKMANLCLEYGVTIIADEIHSDLIFSPHKHVPLASIAEDIAYATVTCVSPSKTFNLAGTACSVIVSSNEVLKAKIKEILFNNSVDSINPFGLTAFEAAYSYGEQWLNDLLSYLTENRNYLETQFASFSKVKFLKPEGTYLAWLDFRGTALGDYKIKDKLINEAKVAMEPGLKFGINGAGFQRLNFACPRAILVDAVSRLAKIFE